MVSKVENINRSYGSVRKNLLAMSGVSFSDSSVIDFGCYKGANARYLKNNFNGVYYVGVEYNSKAISEMDSLVDEVVSMDLDFFSAEILGPRIFDVVILGDVLEHLKDPEKLLKEIDKITDGNSTLLISIPNIQFYETFVMLFIGRFPRRERGLFDKTHLRWFTKKEFLNLVEDDYKVIAFKRVFRLVEQPSKINRFVPLFLPLLWIFAPFFTFQMLFALKKVNRVVVT